MERLGTCAGFRWEIEWSSRGGDFPEIVATGQDLRGTNVNISSSTLRHGGVWLRPIRGDMLRTVAQEPQVTKCSYIEVFRTCTNSELLLCVCLFHFLTNLIPPLYICPIIFWVNTYLQVYYPFHTLPYFIQIQQRR